MASVSCRVMMRNIQAVQCSRRMVSNVNNTKSIREIVSSVRGSLLDMFAKSVSKNDAKYLAQRWGFDSGSKGTTLCF